MVLRRFTALIEREGSQFVSLCLELDIASQGDSVEEARRKNLIEALELFFEEAGEEEIARRTTGEFYVTSVDVKDDVAPS